MRRVHAKLDHEPVRLELQTRDGRTFEYLLQRRNMQINAAGLIADPESAAQLLEIYLALDRGIEPTFEHIPARLLPDGLTDPGAPISFDAMPIGCRTHRRRPTGYGAEVIPVDDQYVRTLS